MGQPDPRDDAGPGLIAPVGAQTYTHRVNEPVHPRGLRASRAYLVLHAPRILSQKRQLEATAERLPDAARPWEGKLEGPDPLRLVVVGDSTAAGTGAATQEEALPGSLARELHARTGRGVIWRAVGENGADTGQFLERHLTDAVARPVDLVFVSLGANDAIHARSTAAFARDLRTLLETISDRHPHARILVSNLPIFGRFELLPEPLRTTLYRHSLALERAARRVVARDPRWMITEAVPPPYGPDFFASDSFHPSPSGYADWARWAIDEAWPRGLAEIADARVVD